MKKSLKTDGYISKAILSNVRVSPRKARLVADMIRGRAVHLALDVLNLNDKKTAPLIKKLLLSAVANAKNSGGVDVDELKVAGIQVSEGRKYKRFLPRAQGRATPLIKRHSTITITLDEK